VSSSVDAIGGGVRPFRVKFLQELTEHY